MACPTCAHELTDLSDGWFWCPHCGTALQVLDGETPGPVQVPELAGEAIDGAVKGVAS